ncbi:MAG: methyltransferase domain-containing protein [Myxococcota bacterium]
MDLYDRPVRRIEPATAQPASPCPVCDARTAVPTYRVEGVAAPIVVCTQCGHGRFDPLPSDDEIAAFYPADYYGEPGSKFRPAIEGLVRAVAARHVRFLCEGLPAGARVLDVGCGRGVILGPLADRGYEAHGVEISADATRGVDPRAHVRIAPRLADAGYAAGTFDQIVIWHVLEHLRDPRATIEECHRILAPGGRLVVAVPNFASWQARFGGPGWFHLDAPRHLHHFPLPALRALVERCGFACERAHHFSLRQNPFGWIQSAQNRLDPEHPNRLYTALHHPRQGARPRAAERLRAWAWLAALGAPALALSVLEAVCESGATVHVVATRRDGERG